MIAGMSDAPSKVGEIDMFEAGDGFVVYDPVRDRVHFLNHTAAVVLEVCDGTKSDAEIASLLQRCYELPEPPDAETTQCLDQLRQEGLIR
jgi:PqqD family protein of HPr-rel-A system